MNTQWFGINWAGLTYWWMIPLLLGAIAIVWFRFSKINQLIAVLAGKHRQLLIRNFSLIKTIVKALLFSVALVLLCIALFASAMEQKGRISGTAGKRRIYCARYFS